MADGSTTTTITQTNSSLVGYFTVDFTAETSTLISGDIVSLVQTYHVFSGNTRLRRYGLQFAWPNTFPTSTAGSALDPPVIASASLVITTSLVSNSPKLQFYAALGSSVTFDSTLWPGPRMDTLGTGAPAPFSGLIVHDFVNISPLTNGIPISTELTVSTQTFTLNPSALTRLFTSNPSAVWDLNITIIGVLDNEFVAPNGTTFPDNPFGSVSSAVIEADDPVLTIEYIPAHTGFHTNIDDQAPTRAVRDARTGFPALSMNLVEDVFHKGIWTRAQSQDPDDGIPDYGKHPEHRSDRKPVR